MLLSDAQVHELVPLQPGVEIDVAARERDERVPRFVRLHRGDTALVRARRLVRKVLEHLELGQVLDLGEVGHHVVLARKLLLIERQEVVVEVDVVADHGDAVLVGGEGDGGREDEHAVRLWDPR